MSDVSKKSSVRRQRSIQRVHYDIRREEMTARPLGRRAESEVTAYRQQVAGHTGTDDAKYLGLLQCNNGTILKPIIKEAQRREVDFYSRLATTSDPDLVELRRFVPKYFGTTRYCYQGHFQEYIILEDLTQRMMEPCIMDIKIGRRTWDPLASEEKIKKEQSKYALCKQQYAFCIPGYQVYGAGRRARYGKEHGKALHGQAVKDGEYVRGAGGVSRALVLQLVGALWRLARWARRPRALALYGASLLLVHDAAPSHREQEEVGPGWSRRSLRSTGCSASFSGQLSAAGPTYRKLSPVRVSPMNAQPFAPHVPSSNEAWERLHHNHSFDHNYEDKLSKIKMNYREMLDELSYDSPNPSLGTVKIIDFAHAFFNEEEEKSVDDNFREGIESLVQVLEEILRETDNQVI